MGLGVQGAFEEELKGAQELMGNGGCSQRRVTCTTRGPES